MAINQKDIATDGDVLLIVGRDTNEGRLRVSSATLSTTSPVFKALLGPHFREGSQARSSASPVEIPLPDDDPLIVSHVCNLLHLKHVKTFKTGLSPKTLYQIAVVVDKYDCCEALQVQTRGMLFQWLFNNSSNVLEPGALADVTAAAYLLREPQCFKILTGKLVSHTTGSINSIRKQESGKAIPVEVLCTVLERRDCARAYLINSLTTFSQCHYCRTTDYTGFLQATSKALGSAVWPPDFNKPQTETIWGAVLRLERMAEYPLSCCKAKGQAKAGKVDTFMLCSVASFLTKLCDGICLQCVLDDEFDSTEKCTKHT